MKWTTDVVRLASSQIDIEHDNGGQATIIEPRVPSQSVFPDSRSATELKWEWPFKNPAEVPAGARLMNTTRLLFTVVVLAVLTSALIRCWSRYKSAK